MKKFSKIFLIVVLAAVMLLMTTVSYAQTQTMPGRHDPRTEGVQSGYLAVDGETGHITGIAPGTTLTQLNKLMTPGDLTADSDVIGTGTTLYSQTAGQRLTAVVCGDVNGDADISITDMLLVKSHILGTELTGAALVAGNVNGDEDVSITDFLEIKSYLLGLSTISSQPSEDIDSALILAPGETQKWNAAGASYVSDQEALVAISAEGQLTAGSAEGTAFVYALDENGTVLARKAVTVLEGGLQVSFGRTAYIAYLGQSVQVDTQLNHPVKADMTWQSSDPSVCSVNEEGVITGHTYGDTVLRVTLPNGTYSEVLVKVMPPITDMQLSSNLYKVKPGASRPLTLSMTPADSGEEVIWTSSDPQIATVDEFGNVTGVKKGTVTVTATGRFSGLSASCSVKVCNVIQVAITFDDGPSKHTPKLLDYLKESGIKATFFIVCNRINSFKATTKRIVDEGHELGYHSYSHKNHRKLTTEQIKSDFSKSCDIVENLTGATFTLWRAPGGAINDRVLDAIDLPHIMWSVDTLDWKYRNVDHVYNAILNNSDDGEIILLHDLHKTSVEGAIKAMKVMQAGDYEFLTVTELLSRNGKAPSNNKSYSKVK